MKVINSSAHCFSTIHTNPYRFIEVVGRTCYKSEDKITDDSAVKFVKNMYSSKHHAMLEHYHVMIKMDKNAFDRLDEVFRHKGYKNSIDLTEFLNLTYITSSGYEWCYVSGSFRAFIDVCSYINGTDIGHTLISALSNQFPELFESYLLLDDSVLNHYEVQLITWREFESDVASIPSISKDDKNRILSHHIPISCHFVCDRGVSHEFVRHRRCAFAQESTRYCNYSGERFEGEITVIDSGFEGQDRVLWNEAMQTSEMMYFGLLSNGAKPQMARGVLPTDLKTELWMTTTEEEWQHIIDLRYHGTTGAPHPKMLDIMTKAYPQLCCLSNYRLK